MDRWLWLEGLAGAFCGEVSVGRLATTPFRKGFKIFALGDGRDRLSCWFRQTKAYLGEPPVECHNCITITTSST